MGRARVCPLGPSRACDRCDGGSRNGARLAGRPRGSRRRRTAPHGMTSYGWLDGIRRGEVAASFHLAVRPNLGRPARLGRIVTEVVVCPGARAATEHAVRLGVQELRPAGADPSRRRPEPRAAQHGRDRGGRDADPELQQLALDTHVAPARVLSRQPPDQAAASRPQAADGRACAGGVAGLPQAMPGASGGASADRPQSWTTARTGAAGSPQRARPGRQSCTAAASRRV
jgi:hypothetical protein